MIPYKDIGDNLTVNEFNGVISLLRDNINFEENLTINNSTVKGQYAEYVFDFQEATVLDNGILITNETLSNIGTVKLTKAVFPHSNYFLDLKVYSSTDVGISDMEHSDYIVTELSIPLRHNAEVNIPFETLEMDNIISFDAKIRINHKDLIIRGTDRLSLSTIRNPLLNYVPSNLEAVYVDADGHPVTDKQVNFYEGETLLGTDTTDGSGIATLNTLFSSIGSYNIQATSESLFSNNLTLDIVDDGDLVFSINGNKLETYVSSPFVFVGNELQVNYGDNTGSIYTDGKLSHNYANSGNYTINILGEITEFKKECFKNSNLKSITIPSSVTTIKESCFANCTGLTSVTLPNTLVNMEKYLFANCTALTSVSIPNSVTSIENNCFERSGLTSISIPNTVTSIGNYCFTNCTNLTSVILPNNFTALNGLFNGCTSLTSFTIPNGVTTLGYHCFNSTGLTSIVIPNTVTSIGYMCFYHTELTTINIPSSVTDIGQYAFGYSNNLQEIVLNWDNSSEIISYDSNWIYLCDSFSHFLIPQGTTSLYTAKGYPSNLLVEDITYDGLSNLTLTDGNQILSYADEQQTPNTQYATLETQLMNGQSPAEISGVTVSFYDYTNASNPVLLGSDDTDSNGKASFTYHSVGAGDVPIKAKVGSFVSKTCEVEDNVLWKPDVSTIPVTSKSIRVKNNTESRLCLNNPIDLPSSFVMTGTVKRVSSSAQQVLIGCGVDKDNMYEFPVLRSNGNMTFRNNIESTLLIDEYVFGTNTDVPFSYTYDGNGNHTLSVNNISRTVTSSAISMDKFISLQLGSNGRLSNLKIKPL